MDGIIITRFTNATDADYELAQKLVSYLDAQITEDDPSDYHILSACVTHDHISVLCKDNYTEAWTMEEAVDYIANVDYARAHGTGAYI